MSTFVRFTKAVAQYKAGETAELPDPIARAWLDLPDTAVEVSSDPHTRAIQDAMSHMVPLMQEQGRTIAAELRRSNGSVQRPNLTAGSGHGEDFSTIEHVQSEVDKRRGPGHWLRSIVDALGNPNTEARSAAHAELIRPWSEGGYGCQRTTMTEGSGVTGGYTTPVVYESQVFEIAAEQSVVVNGATNKPLAARQVEWPSLDQYRAPSEGQSAFFGGVQVFRKGETVHRVESSPLFKKIQMLAQDLTAYTTISRDLIQDSTIAIDAFVIRLIGEAIGWREDWESIWGSGVGQFLGFMKSPALIAVARNTALSIVYQDIFNMNARLLVNAQDPCWIIHPFAIAALQALQDPSGKFIFIPNSYANAAPPAPAGGGVAYPVAGYLLGYPIYRSEKTKYPLGTQGDIALVDRKSYWVGRRSGLEVGLSEHFLFDQDELAIRAKVRNDGKPGQLSPIILSDGVGSNTVSGFVTLTTKLT